MLRLLLDPETHFTTTPQNVMTYASYQRPYVLTLTVMACEVPPSTSRCWFGQRLWMAGLRLP